MKPWKIVLGFVLPMASQTCGQQPSFVNATLQTASLAGTLENAIQTLADKQVEPAWIGYSARGVEGKYHICCSTYTNRNMPSVLQRAPCKLETSNDGMNLQINGDNKSSAASEYIVVLFRAAERKIGRIRVFSHDCELDAGGLKVHWLTDVPPQQSVEFLTRFVPANEGEFREARHMSETAIAAIALHADSSAERALERMIDAKQPEIVRRNVAFWLGDVRGEKGYNILKRIIREDTSDKVREQSVFALSLSPVPEAVTTMIESARNDKSPKVRGQALFWLAQKAGKPASDALTEVAASDPETEVKKKAVFALSRLPEGEGVPKLIQIARTSKNREVRKDAMFWLGQSKDPRALQFFEEVLVKN